MAKSERDDADDRIEEPRAKPRRPAPRDSDEDIEEPRRPRRRPVEDDVDDDYEDERPRKRRGGVSSIIPYHNGMALASYYCGMGGLIVTLGSIALAAFMAGVMTRGMFLALFAGVGGILALLALVFGIIGASRAKRSGGMAHSVIGIILGALEIIGVALVSIGVVAIR